MQAPPARPGDGVLHKQTQLLNDNYYYPISTRNLASVPQLAGDFSWGKQSRMTTGVLRITKQKPHVAEQFRGLPGPPSRHILICGNLLTRGRSLRRNLDGIPAADFKVSLLDVLGDFLPLVLLADSLCGGLSRSFANRRIR